MQRELRNALYDAVAAIDEDRLGIAFSGGLDSTLLAKICTDLGKDVLLMTVGFPGSQDLEFSKKVASMLGLPLKTVEILEAGFAEQILKVRQIISCGNTSHIENCIAYLYIAQIAGKESVQTVLSANGCDELFCGYNAYRLAYALGPDALRRLMEQKIANEYELVGEISAVAAGFGVKIKQPFLASGFVEYAKTIPLEEKIRGSDDSVRKHILRRVALDVGVPDISAMKPKKALQYGSLIHKNYQRAKLAEGLGTGITRPEGK